MKQAALRRSVGQTKDVGFEIGVRRMLATSPQPAWDALTSDDGLKLWLGKTSGWRSRARTDAPTLIGCAG
ncbi:MAG: hypothetical protein U0559_00910 [Anaerolineae bacterium]